MTSDEASANKNSRGKPRHIRESVKVTIVHMKTFFLKLAIQILIVISCMHLAACHHTHGDAYDSKGNAIRMSDYQGKWVLINYWATWCKPCLAEMPALERLYQRHQRSLIVLGVSYDHLHNKKINHVAQQLKITYPLLRNFPIKKYYQHNISVLPVTFILNPQGKLIDVLKGPRSEKQFADILGFTH